MRLTNYIYPHIDEDPREGCQMIDSTRYRCTKCIQYGIINPEEMRTEPCTICAMANGGAWGWEDGHYGDPRYSFKTNGCPPGRDSITDVLSNHDVDPDNDWFITDEEVVLGFAQYALYNHYKWKDILDLKEGVSKHRTGIPPMSYLQPPEDNTDYHWYWWKIIPYGVVLPKRLRNVLEKQLVQYQLEMVNSELFVPKTHQLKGDRELSDDIWETFWDTYVEPGHVAHLFSLTLKTILEICIPHTSIRESQRGWFNQELNSFTIVEHQDIEECNLPECDKLWVYLCCPSRFTENTKYFILRGEGLLFNDNYSEGERILRILDRDIFGTYLTDVITYTCRNAFYRRGNIMNHSHSIKDLWNTLNNDIFSLSFDVVRNLCIESTDWFEERLMYVHIMDDYGNERFFREDNYSTIVSDNGDDNSYHVIEYEINTHGEEDNIHEWTEHINKLKELQMIIDDDGVKDKIDEGIYLKLMNGLGELYKMYQ
tara:strand:- start:9051 stop:10499 length:1449 start_codon:yes stop_codon:yes gene_type:complete